MHSHSNFLMYTFQEMNFKNSKYFLRYFLKPFSDFQPPHLQQNVIDQLTCTFRCARRKKASACDGPRCPRELPPPGTCIPDPLSKRRTRSPFSAKPDPAAADPEIFASSRRSTRGPGHNNTTILLVPRDLGPDSRILAPVN